MKIGVEIDELVKRVAKMEVYEEVEWQEYRGRVNKQNPGMVKITCYDGRFSHVCVVVRELPGAIEQWLLVVMAGPSFQTCEY